MGGCGDDTEEDAVVGYTAVRLPWGVALFASSPYPMLPLLPPATPAAAAAPPPPPPLAAAAAMAGLLV